MNRSFLRISLTWLCVFAAACSAETGNTGGTADIGGGATDTTGGGGSDIAVDSAGAADGTDQDVTAADTTTTGDTGGDAAIEDAAADTASDTADTASTDTSDTSSPDTAADGGGDATGGPNSCVGACGGSSADGSCHCDDQCEQFGDCCADYKQVCTGGGGGGGGSCAGKCGGQSGTCWCDASCTNFGDCCSDFQAQCPCESVNCSDGNDCTDDTCDPATGACKTTPSADGNKCSGDGCVEGTCKAGACEPAGNKVDGTTCNDNNACTANDACVQGKCTGADQKVCDDKSNCTLDSCEPSTGCKFTPGNDGQACDDGEDCTADDKCAGGKCEGTDKADGTPCDDGDDCTLSDKCDTGFCDGDTAPSDTKCDDGNACTSDDTCSSFLGCYGTSKNCNDNDSCTTDSCDKATGDCKHETKADGATCNDNDDCTTSDNCVSGSCTGTPKAEGASCTDGNACTLGDVCTGGTCAGKGDASAKDKSCSDGDGCTTGDKCDDGGACIGDPNLKLCDDGDPCTLDLCDNVNGSGKCSHNPAADGAACEDGNPCTTGEACSAGACAGGQDKCGASSWSDDFACGKDNGWVLDPKAEKDKTVGWGIDGEPSPPGAKSPACSLNFNNDKNYDNGSTVTGTATSAAVALPADATAVLAFESYNGVEQSSSYDKRYVEASADDFATTPVSVQLNNAVGVGSWTKLYVSLEALKGKTVKIRFRFDSGDSVSNTTAGWFVDDVAVYKIGK